VRRLPLPRLDEYGVLWRDPSWVSLSPIEGQILATLLEKPGVVCSRETLARNAWPDGVQSCRSVDMCVKRLRRRIEPLGLAIRTVRQRGYFLELDAGS
jgi:DNA-binding response OmpR family regulator